MTDHTHSPRPRRAGLVLATVLVAGALALTMLMFTLGSAFAGDGGGGASGGSTAAPAIQPVQEEQPEDDQSRPGREDCPEEERQGGGSGDGTAEQSI